jgi:hypothetical protein
MSHKAKLSGPEKIATIEKYLHGEDSLNECPFVVQPLSITFTKVAVLLKNTCTYKRELLDILTKKLALRKG